MALAAFAGNKCYLASINDSCSLKMGPEKTASYIKLCYLEHANFSIEATSSTTLKARFSTYSKNLAEVTASVHKSVRISVLTPLKVASAHI